jgi:uncharacterized membrane protein
MSSAPLTSNSSSDGSSVRVPPAQLLWQLLPIVASFAFGAWLYPRLPASVPVHWDLNGTVDRFGGPAEAAFMLPLIMLPVALLMLAILPRFIPGGADFAGTRAVYYKLVAMVLWFMVYVQVLLGYMFRGIEIHLLGLLTLGAGVLFILMGNLLPKLRRNPIAGARLPWAMQDPVVWVKTQRAAGISFMVLGAVLVCISPLPGFLPLALLLLGKAAALAAVIWYSLQLVRRERIPG